MKLFTKKLLAHLSKILLLKLMQPLIKVTTFYVLLKYLMSITNKQQNDLVNLFKPNIRVLANFYGTKQVDQLQGKKSNVDAIIDREEVLKELSNFLLDYKNVFQC